MRMRLLGLGTALFAAATVCGQAAAKKPTSTVEQILARHAKAVGGAQGLNQAKSWRVVVTFKLNDMDVEATILKKGPKVLATFRAPAFGSFRFGFDGKTVWKEEPQKAAQVTGKSELEDLLGGTGDLLDPTEWLSPAKRRTYRSLSLAGVRKFGGREAYAVKTVPMSGATELRFIDCETFLLLGEETLDKKGKATFKCVYSDFRRVGGLLTAFRGTADSNGEKTTYQIDEFTLGEELDDALFRFPTPPKWLTADEVLARYSEAVGGEKALASVKSLAKEYVLDLKDAGVKTTKSYFRDGDKYLTVDRDEREGTSKAGYDGRTIWSLDPARGLTTIVSAQAPDWVKAERLVAGPYGFLFDWKAGGFKTLEMRGIENVGVDPAYAVRMTPKEGPVSVRFFDCRTFLLLREDQEDKDGGVALTTLFGSYRRVGGVSVPFVSWSDDKGHRFRQTTTSLKIGEPIDPKVFGVPPAPTGPTADEVLAAYVEAIGGDKAYEPLRSFAQEAAIVGGKGRSFYYRDGDKYAEGTDLPDGGGFRFGHDGKTGWTDRPREGLKIVADMPMRPTDRICSGPHKFLDALRDRSRYTAVFVRGIEDVAGKPAYAVRVKPRKGTAYTYYFDRGTHLLVRDECDALADGTHLVSLYADYRSVAGIKVPFLTTIEYVGTVSVSKVTLLKVNEPIDPSVFAVPSKSAFAGKDRGK